MRFDSFRETCILIGAIAAWMGASPGCIGAMSEREAPQAAPSSPSQTPDEPGVVGVQRSTTTPLSTAIEAAFSFAQQQLKSSLSSLSPTQHPSVTQPNGDWAVTGPGAWTSGFFEGALWKMYEKTG